MTARSEHRPKAKNTRIEWGRRENGSDQNTDVNKSKDREVPETGVRKSSQSSRHLHRHDEDADEIQPACGESERDGDFFEVHIPSLIGFNRWSLCSNPECFGEDSEDTDTGNGVRTDGGHPDEQAPEIVLRGFQDDNADRIEALLDEALKLDKIAVRRER